MPGLLLAEQGEPTRRVSQGPNCLNWIEVTQSPISRQVMLDFSSPIYLEKTIKKESLELELTFPGMHLGSLDMDKVDAQFAKLKDDGIINNFDVSERTGKLPAVVVTLTFAKTKKIEDSTNKIPHQAPNKLVIYWSKFDNPHRLVLDIFSKEGLDALSRKEALLLHASNNVIQSDSQPQRPLPYRIVIDAGHGASDTGAKGFSHFTEKDITLAVAKRVQSIIEKDNPTANVTLTRDCDKEISLQERAELAGQLNAHLFVSIHVNSAGKPESPASGIETFYLESKKLIPPTRTGGFMFVNLAKDNALINTIDTSLKNSLTLSKNLAQCIQTNLLSSLKQKKFSPIDRGIKPSHFRVLFQNAVPSALVEIGFITNRKEAKLLEQEDYQDLVAHGIVKGINGYLTSYR